MTPERSKKKTRTQGILQNSKWVAGGKGREKETTYFKTSDMNCPEKENVYKAKQISGFLGLEADGQNDCK